MIYSSGPGSPGEVQIRPVPSALGDPSSPGLHDMVLGGSPGEVQVRVPPVANPSSPSSHDIFLRYWLAWRSTKSDQYYLHLEILLLLHHMLQFFVLARLEKYK